MCILISVLCFEGPFPSTSSWMTQRPQAHLVAGPRDTAFCISQRHNSDTWSSKHPKPGESLSLSLLLDLITFYKVQPEKKKSLITFNYNSLFSYPNPLAPSTFLRKPIPFTFCGDGNALDLCCPMS